MFKSKSFYGMPYSLFYHSFVFFSHTTILHLYRFKLYIYDMKSNVFSGAVGAFAIQRKETF